MINKASLLKHCLSKFTNKKDKKSVEWFIQGLNLESGIESLIESMHKMMPALWKDGKSINAVMYCYNYIKEALPKKYHDQEELFRRNGKRYTNDLDESVQLGGEPKWIQNNEHPNCCDSMMIFVGSFGRRKQSDGWKSDFIMGDCGKIYVFFCPKCQESTTKFQQF